MDAGEDKSLDRFLKWNWTGHVDRNQESWSVNVASWRSWREIGNIRRRIEDGTTISKEQQY